MRGKTWEIYKQRKNIVGEGEPPDYPVCPVCGSEVIKPEGEAMHRCTNTACPSQALERIKHFVSRGAMDIDGVGERLCAALFTAGLVKDASDLYKLTKQKLRGAKKKVKVIISKIEEAILDTHELSRAQLPALKRITDETLSDRRKLEDVCVKYHLTAEKILALKEKIGLLLPKILNQENVNQNLTWDHILTLEKLADKSISNVLNSIKESKENKDRSLARVIFALGITHVGEQYAELLTDRFSSIDELAKASVEDLLTIKSIGPKIAQSIVAFFRQKENKQLVKKLQKALKEPEGKKAKEAKPEELPWAGREFVFTGKLDSFSRSEAEAKIKDLGGKVGSDVTKKTSYIVVGADPGSKLAKAQKLGTKTLSETEFLELLDKPGEKI